MNAPGCSFLALVLTCCAAQPADNAALKQTAKAKVEEINAALIKEDFGKIVDLTHPKLVELLGGRDKAIAKVEAATKEMKAKGFTVRSGKVEEPSEPVAAGNELYIVVPFQLEMKAPGGRMLIKSFSIGVSNDQGKSWTFLNGDQELAQVKQMLPNLPEALKLPERQKPVFEKD
jgi:hypothetical protein